MILVYTLRDCMRKLYWRPSMYSSSVFCRSSCILVSVGLSTTIQHCCCTNSSDLGVLQYNIKKNKSPLLSFRASSNRATTDGQKVLTSVGYSRGYAFAYRHTYELKESRGADVQNDSGMFHCSDIEKYHTVSNN